MAVLNKHVHGIPPGAVYIGRGSKWGNPFVIGTDGTRERVIAKYEASLQMLLARDDPAARHLRRQLADLDGKDLVCFCAPQACHGDVLARYAQDAAQYLTFHPEDR